MQTMCAEARADACAVGRSAGRQIVAVASWRGFCGAAVETGADTQQAAYSAAKLPEHGAGARCGDQASACGLATNASSAPVGRWADCAGRLHRPKPRAG